MPDSRATAATAPTGRPVRRLAGQAGVVTAAPLLLLRAEALLVAVLACAAYARLGVSWWLFAALFFVPDLSMLAYRAGPAVGAAVYDAAHWYVPPLALVAWGAFGRAPEASSVGLVWAAHIGVDRALGYGFKYGDGFGVTHLGLIGEARGGRRGTPSSPGADP